MYVKFLNSIMSPKMKRIAPARVQMRTYTNVLNYNINLIRLNSDMINWVHNIYLYIPAALLCFSNAISGERERDNRTVVCECII